MSRTRRAIWGAAAAALCAGALVPLAALPASAASSTAEAAVIADITFENGTTSFTGGGATAAVQGTANLVEGPTGKAAKISSAFWLKLTKADGTPLLAGLDDVTISYDSKPDAGTGNLGWTVFAAPSTATQTYQQEHYLGFLDKTTGVTVERYNNSGARDSSGNLSVTAANADWKHVDLVVSGSTSKLYVNQQLVASKETGVLLSTILGSSGGVVQLGKGNWVSGEYFSGLLDNVRVYNRALTADEIAGIEPAPALAVTATATTRCVAGKAVVVATTTDGDAVPVSFTATGVYGTASGALEPGAATSKAFSTRAATIPAGAVTITATGTVGGTPVTAEVEASYPAASCG